MQTTRAVLAALIALPFAGVLAAVPLRAAAAQPEAPVRPVPQPSMGQQIINGLLATEGCLGADAAELQSGKLAIIAWFKDVESVKRWYYSETHTRFMSMAGADPQAREPMQHIENPDAPVMVIAALTLGPVPPRGGSPLNQISIEMYTPLPGGAAINGRLAPAGFVIPHFRDLSPGLAD
ncbi:MAG: hypothetical protein LAT64_13910 [Phycisphaerales bacterium]|nr:hypothetical protein [Planctomycetota bacterium]MCH8509845.1 hypothetical protein [Phycisphaerales bacterium]